MRCALPQLQHGPRNLIACRPCPPACPPLPAGYLKKQEIPMVIVSHDREFLDQLCTKIVETERGVSATFKGAPGLRGSADVCARAGRGGAGFGRLAGWQRCTSGALLGLGGCRGVGRAAVMKLKGSRSPAADSERLFRTHPASGLLSLLCCSLPCLPRQLYRVCEAEGGGHRPAVGGLGEAAEGDLAAGAAH